MSCTICSAYVRLTICILSLNAHWNPRKLEPSGPHEELGVCPVGQKCSLHAGSHTLRCVLIPSQSTEPMLAPSSLSSLPIQVWFKSYNHGVPLSQVFFLSQSQEQGNLISVPLLCWLLRCWEAVDKFLYSYMMIQYLGHMNHKSHSKMGALWHFTVVAKPQESHVSCKHIDTFLCLSFLPVLF